MGKFGILSIKKMLLLPIMLLRVSGTDHTIGGPTGWDLASDMWSWASKTHFMIGDNLVFVYKPDHDVIEVGERGYEQCEIQSPIHTHCGGNTVIPLMNPGTRYFVCGNPIYCFQGLKIKINILLPFEKLSSSPINETGSCATAPIGSDDQVKSPDATPNLCRSGGPPSLPSYDYPPTEFPLSQSPSHNGNRALTVKDWVLYLVHYWYVLVLVLGGGGSMFLLFRGKCTCTCESLGGSITSQDPKSVFKI